MSGRVSAILVGAGSSRRMGRDKLSILIDGRSVLQRSLEALEASSVQEIVLVTRPGNEAAARQLAAGWGITKLRAVVAGGETRALSVKNGVAACSPDAVYYCIHDAARPFASPELIDRVLADARLHRAAAPALPVVDTVK